MTWFQRSTYTPSGGPVAPAAAPGNLGGGLVDLKGNEWGIGSTNTLYAVSAGGGGAINWIDGVLLLPASDNPADFNTQLRTYFNAVNNQNIWQTYRVTNAGDDSTQTGLLVGYNGGTLACYTYVGGSLAAPTAVSGTTAPTLTPGTNYYLEASCVQTNGTTTTITAKVFTAGGTQMGDTFVWTTTVSALQNIVGRMGLFYSNSASPAAYGDPGPITRIDYYDDVVSPALVLSPSSQSVLNSAAASLTATLSNSSASLTAATTAGTLSTASPTSGTPFTLTAPGSGSGTATVTVTDSTDSLVRTATVSYSPGPVQVNTDDTNLFLSPYSWKKTGSGSSARAEARMPGAYLQAVVTGTTAISLTIDGSLNNGISGALPVIQWSIDNGAMQTATITDTNHSGTYQMSLATGLSTGSHTLFVSLKANTLTSARWTGGTVGLRIAGLLLDIGGSLSTYSARSKRAVFYGDSITEGIGTDAFASGLTYNNSLATWAPLVASALDAEYGQLGTGGQAVAVDGVIPMLTTTWNKYDSTLTARDFTQAPDYVFINGGTNDYTGTFASPNDITSAYTTWLASIRATLSSAKIFCVVPINGSHASQISAAVAARVSAGDSNVFVVNIAEAVAWAPAGGAASIYSYDGVHPSQLGHAYYGSEITQRVQAALGGTTTSIVSMAIRAGSTAILSNGQAVPLI